MVKIIKVTFLTFIFMMFNVVSVNAETIKVRLETKMGEIHIDLYGDNAPITVANFLKYIDGGYFLGGSFYRVVHMKNQEQNNIKIEVIQGGASGSNDEERFDPIILERTNMTGLKHVDGTISMARGGPDTAGAEFFICINDQPSLDFGGMRNEDGQGFAAFGMVTKGMDVVRAIQNVKTKTPEGELQHTSGQSVLEPIIFKSFTRE